MKSISLFFVFFSFFTASCLSQNNRDKVIHETIKPILDSYMPVDQSDYLKIKNLILKLDEDYGYEADLHLKLLHLSYKQKDLDFFKSNLELLVEKYGFTVAYMTGSESYQEAIMTNELKSWFKPMYISKHAVWLENNFEKQLVLKKLNEIRVKDEIGNQIAMAMDPYVTDSVSKIKIRELRQDFSFKTVYDIYQIARKFNLYPTGKNFAVIQQDFSKALQRNFMNKNNLDRTWGLLESYFKQAYLKNDMDYDIFKKYDIYSFAVTGYQKIGLVTLNDIPKYFQYPNKEISEVPIENAFFSKKYKSEMGW